jgi:hypothetical protein
MSFDINLFDEDERAAAKNFTALIQLRGWAKKCETALSLFDVCQELNSDAVLAGNFEEAKRTLDWSYVAARDFSMSVYHFGRSIEGISVSLGQMPKFRQRIDQTTQKSTRKEFEKKFPWYIKLRHALAHDAERLTTSASYEKHALTPAAKAAGPDLSIDAGSQSRLLLESSLRNRRLSSMWEGEVVWCDITQETVSFLWVTYNAYEAIFREFLIKDDSPKITFSRRAPKGATVISVK